MNRVVEYLIRAKDATASGISSAMSKIKGFAAGVGKNLANIQAGFQMAAQAAQKLWGALQKAFAFERMTAQFKTLIGNMDKAREHMQMLRELGDTPPFSLEEFAKASRELMVMSNGVLGFRESLKMVGDVAAKTGQPIEAVGNAVGRAYGIIRDGQPVARAVMQLRNMGLITPAVAEKLDDLQKAGATNAEVWGELETALKTASGAMKDTEKTGEGLMGALSSRWDDTLRDFGAAFLEVSKEGIGSLVEKLKELQEDGTIDEWADACHEALMDVIGWVKEAIAWFGKLKGWYDNARDWLQEKGAQAGAYVGTLVGGGSFADAAEAAKVAGEQERAEIADNRAEKAAEAEAKAEERKARARKRANDKLVAEQKAVEEEKKKIAEDLAKAQIENEKRAAIEAAKKAAEEKEKADKKAAEEAIRLAEKEKQARIKAAEKSVAESEKAYSSMEQRLDKAREAVQTAWGWYKDKDSMQKKIDDVLEQRAAEAQWEKDFQKLKDHRRDWRDVEFGKLSAEEEAVRQVAFAKEEEKAAQIALDEIAENTAYLKGIAEALTTTEEA